jgi:hypothetical protein
MALQQLGIGDRRSELRCGAHRICDHRMTAACRQLVATQQNLIQRQIHRSAQPAFQFRHQPFTRTLLELAGKNHRADLNSPALLDAHVQLVQACALELQALTQHRLHIPDGTGLGDAFLQRVPKRDGEHDQHEAGQGGLPDQGPGSMQIAESVPDRHARHAQGDGQHVGQKQHEGALEDVHLAHGQTIAGSGQRRHQRGGDGNTGDGADLAVGDGIAGHHPRQYRHQQVEQVGAGAGEDFRCRRDVGRQGDNQHRDGQRPGNPDQQGLAAADGLLDIGFGDGEAQQHDRPHQGRDQHGADDHRHRIEHQAQSGDAAGGDHQEGVGVAQSPFRQDLCLGGLAIQMAHVASPPGEEVPDVTQRDDGLRGGRIRGDGIHGIWHEWVNWLNQPGGRVA